MLYDAVRIDMSSYDYIIRSVAWYLAELQMFRKTLSNTAKQGK